MSSLSDNTTLYRAVTKKGWIDPDNQEVDAEAFILRSYKDRPNEDSLSAGLKPEDTYNRLKKCYGVISFSLSDLRKLELDAIQDAEDHVKIINLPDPDLHPKEALDIAVQIARKSKLVINWLDKPYKKNK